MKRWLLGAALCLGAAAWADIPPTDSSGCREKNEGATCKRDDGSAGACAKSTCTRNDYSNGPPPTSVEYECLVCATAPASAKKSSCAAVPSEALVVLLLALARRRGR